MGKLIVFNFILIALIVLGLWLVKRYIKKERAQSITLLVAAIFTVVFHYSAFGIKLLFGTGAVAYLSETPNLLLPIYPCNVVMWSAVIFAVLKNKRSKVGDFFVDYLFWFGIFSDDFKNAVFGIFGKLKKSRHNDLLNDTIFAQAATPTQNSHRPYFYHIETIRRD